VAARNEADVEKTRGALRLDFVLVPGPQPELYRRYAVANPANERLPRPSAFLIDRQGILRWQHVGRDDNDRAKSPKILEELARFR
jgi:peroxiredoxin